MIIEQVLVCGLATWRLASLLVHEAGPGDVFGRLRRLAGVPGPGYVGPDPGFFASLLSCLWCTSAWLAPVLWLLWSFEPVIPAIMAAAGVAVIVESLGVRHGQV